MGCIDGASIVGSTGPVLSIDGAIAGDDSSLLNDAGAAATVDVDGDARISEADAGLGSNADGADSIVSSTGVEL